MRFIKKCYIKALFYSLIFIKVLYNGFIMLSRESKIDSIVDIIHDQLKGKHKDKLAKELAEKILDAIEDESPTWYEHG